MEDIWGKLDGSQIIKRNLSPGAEVFTWEYIQSQFPKNICNSNG